MFAFSQKSVVWGFFCLFVLPFVFLPFLGPLPPYMEISRLGGLIRAVARRPTPQPQQRGIQAPQLTATPDP